MSQEVALQLIALGGTLVASLTTVALAYIAMRRAGQAVKIGTETHALIKDRFDGMDR